MGYASKTCAVSNLPVMAGPANAPIELTEMVALRPDGTIVRGIHDGSGRVNEVNLLEDKSYWDAKFVLAKFFKEGMTFENLPPSHDDRGQGFFHDDVHLLAWLAQGGFSSHEEYLKAYAAAYEADEADVFPSPATNA